VGHGNGFPRGGAVQIPIRAANGSRGGDRLQPRRITEKVLRTPIGLGIVGRVGAPNVTTSPCVVKRRSGAPLLLSRVMICPPHPPAPLVLNWLERHRDARSFVLHIIGIPLTLMGVLLFPVYAGLLSFPVFIFALSLFIGGYLIQFLGHALDGTEPGEWFALKKWVGRKYAAAVARPKSRRRVA
jgi:hypothetical protein